MDRSVQASSAGGTTVVSVGQLRSELSRDRLSARLVDDTRERIARILAGDDDRLALIVGPCSIHDAQAAFEFARRLAPLRARHADSLEIVMRVYFEKPRTRGGWKGLINDPWLDDSFGIEEGLRMARGILLGVKALDVPAATEFLDPITAPYLEDLVSWGAIGARTTESQIHRQTASGLTAPIGFKNGSDGNVKIAIDGALASRAPHRYLRPADRGGIEVVATSGNPHTHVVLRGGKTPNYDTQSIAGVCAALRDAHLPPFLVVDASHGNSGKQARAQLDVCENLASQLTDGQRAIAGVMIESFLVEGRQDIVPGRPLVFGQSVTDACLGWNDTARVIEQLSAAVAARRRSHVGFVARRMPGIAIDAVSC